MIQNQRSPFQYQANYAYSSHSVVSEMAQHYRVTLNSNSVAGLPQDTFRRSRTLTSTRNYNPPSAGKVFLKSMGQFFSEVASLIGIAGWFYPPAAAIAQVAEPVSSVVSMATNQIDTRPQPVQLTTRQKYNYWFR